LAIRRELILIRAEDTVNVAYDAPVDSSPREQIEEAERRLYQIRREAGATDGGFQRFSDALKIAVDMAARAYERDGNLSGVATGPRRPRTAIMGGLQPPIWVPGGGARHWARRRSPPNIRVQQSPRRTGRSLRARRHGRRTINGGIVGFFSLEMSSEANWRRASFPRRAVRGVPPTRSAAATSPKQDSTASAEAVREMQAIPFYIDRNGGYPIAQLTARARRLKRQRAVLDLLRRRLSAAADGRQEQRATTAVQEIDRDSRWA